MAVHPLVEHWLSPNRSRRYIPRASAVSKLNPAVRNMFAPFESLPQYLLSWLTFFGVLSLLSDKFNHVTQASCHIVSTRWFTSTKHSTLIVWVTGSDFKWSINKQMTNWRAPALTCAASILLPCLALPFIKNLQKEVKESHGPEGSRRFRLPDFMTFETWRWWGCQPHAPAAITPRNVPGTHFH